MTDTVETAAAAVFPAYTLIIDNGYSLVKITAPDEESLLKMMALAKGPATDLFKLPAGCEYSWKNLTPSPFAGWKAEWSQRPAGSVDLEHAQLTALTRRHVLAGAAATAACAAVPAAVVAKPRTTVADYVKDIAAGFLDEETALHKLQLETREQLVECMRLNGLTLLQNRYSSCKKIRRNGVAANSSSPSIWRGGAAPSWMRRVE